MYYNQKYKIKVVLFIVLQKQPECQLKNIKLLGVIQIFIYKIIIPFSITKVALKIIYSNEKQG